MVDQIDIEKLMAREGEAGEGATSALPGLVRELIRTPGFKELLLIHLRDVNPENAKELIRNVIWEDVAFSMSAIGASPGLVNWLAEALVERGVQLNNFTIEILRDFLVKMGGDLDTEKLKSIPAAYAPLVNELLLDDREALDGLIAGLGSLAEDMAQAAERTWRSVWFSFSVCPERQTSAISAVMSCRAEARKKSSRMDVCLPTSVTTQLATATTSSSFVPP